MVKHQVDKMTSTKKMIDESKPTMAIQHSYTADFGAVSDADRAERIVR
jgi:hypothetical protein